jgi:hypothetical protein
MPILFSRQQSKKCYTEITATASEKLTGGAKKGRVIGSGSSPLIAVNASPIIVVAPLLTSSTNSFNFINDNTLKNSNIQVGSTYAA